MCIRDSSKAEIKFHKKNFEVSISTESEQQALDLCSKLKSKIAGRQKDHEKRAYLLKAANVIVTYKDLYQKALGRPLDLDISLPTSEGESKELVQSLEVEIEQLKEEQRRREARDKEDLLKAQELQMKLNEGVVQPSAPPVRQASFIPPKADPKVVEVMSRIKSIYHDNVDYEAANVLLLQANMEVHAALAQYEQLCIVKVKLNYNGSVYDERFSTLTKGEDFLERVCDRCGIPRNHEVFVYKRDYETKPFDSSTMRGRTLGELEICDGMTLCLLSS
eukprot:TRINITY_DN1279_c0_g2_i10.p1 TRINITY_DN1279_c0_g2~~TRINITY_DN1279_c0_g2_i10.p1  ORF type:complete len:277 (-),score=107.63 TRINITY_DN1279_c0_g2_i10:58-888(-)